MKHSNFCASFSDIFHRPTLLGLQTITWKFERQPQNTIIYIFNSYLSKQSCHWRLPRLFCDLKLYNSGPCCCMHCVLHRDVQYSAVPLSSQLLYISLTSSILFSCIYQLTMLVVANLFLHKNATTVHTIWNFSTESSRTECFMFTISYSDFKSVSTCSIF